MAKASTPAAPAAAPAAPVAPVAPAAPAVAPTAPAVPPAAPEVPQMAQVVASPATIPPKAPVPPEATSDAPVDNVAPEASNGKPEGTQQDTAQAPAEPDPLPGVKKDQWDGFRSEWEKDGDLSPDSYKALEQAGYPPELVKNYIAGVQAQERLVVQTVESTVGGPENLSAFRQWANANLSRAQIDEFNAEVSKAVAEGNVNQVAGLYKVAFAAYQQESGTQPNLSSGRAAPSAPRGFRSMAEQIQAQSDPRFATDPAYRDEVFARVAASTYQ